MIAVHAPPTIAPDLTAALSLIKQLAHAKREGDAHALNEAEPLFQSVPGLRETVHDIVNGKTFAKIQGNRSHDRKEIYEKRNVARAREFQRRRLDPAYDDKSDSDLKELCGDRLVRDPAKPGKHLRGLGRSQAIKAIDDGLALIDSGRFALSSG